MKKKKNADVVETEAAEAVTEETKTSKDKKPETETAEDIEKKAEEEAAEIEAYDAEGNPILKKKKKRKSKKKKTQKPEEVNIVKELLSPVSYTHLRAHETDSYLVCRLLLEKKKKNKPTRQAEIHTKR